MTLDLGGDTAMGAYGTAVVASLSVADPLGNSATYEWSFTLEKEVVLADGLFTFGSPDAQRAGQRVPPIPTRILAERAGGGGPIRMNDAEWTLEQVNADSLLIAYTGASAPAFAIDQYLTNMTPATLDEIFYRKVTAVSDDTATKKLTLATADVPAWEVMVDGSVALSADDVAFESDAEGNIIAARSLKTFSASAQREIRPMEVNWSGKSIMGLYELSGETKASFGLPIGSKDPLGNDWEAKVNLKQAKLRMSPTISISADMGLLAGLRKFHSEARVNVDMVLEPEFEFLAASIGYAMKAEDKTGEPLLKHPIVIPLGTSPLWVTVTPSLRAEASVSAGLTGTVSIGASGGYGKTMVFDYEKDRVPALTIGERAGDFHFDLIDPEITIGGTVGVELKILPEVDVKLMSAAGVYLNIDPALKADLNAELSTGSLASADVGIGFDGHINAGSSIIGVDNSLLPAFDPWEIFSWEKRWYFPESLVGVPLQILVQPQSRSVSPGANVILEVQANYGDGVTYEWRQNGRRLFNNSRTLRLYNVTSASAGDYQVTVRRAGSESVNSEVATVTVGNSGPAPEGFALIPAGSFQMGDTFSEGYSSELPVHTVNVSAFYMAKYETTKELWDEVRAWGLNNGYTDLPEGNGSYASKGANHPVHSVNWYDIVKWCNARSQKDGLTPCYTVGGAVFKTGENSSVVCNFAANGYRLPTEAEWEKAARGGLSEKRFPWGDTITHSQANYYSSTSYSYDVSSTRGYHPTYNDGNRPYSSPVGSFAANGYGLYDMAGNMFEWCHDWYGSSYYGSSPASDPRGASSGTYRVNRGGGWYDGANGCRSAYRSYGDDPGIGGIGFRIARSSVPQ